jgi:predicted acyltransferase
MYWMSAATKERLASLIKLSSDTRQRPFTFWLIRAIYLLAALLMGLAFYWKVFVDKIHSFGGILGAGILLLFCISCFLAAFLKNKQPKTFPNEKVVG